MTNKISKVALGALAITLSISPQSFAAEKRTPLIDSPKAIELKLALRDLWSDHIFWVRSLVLASKFGEKEAVKADDAMAVQNAKDIAASITPYYGKEASDKLFTLLAGHYGAIKKYMDVAYGVRKEPKDVVAKKAMTNVGEIAAFLSSANPHNWPKDTLVTLLSAHVGHHMMQIDDIASKNFTAEARMWGEMRKNIYVISDALADGIVKQFPQKFQPSYQVSSVRRTK